MIPRDSEKDNSTLLSTVFKLKGESRDFDFIDLDLSNDLQLYVDPILLYRSPNKKFNDAHALISYFFKQAVDYVKQGKNTLAEEMCHFQDAENLLGLASTGVGHGPRKELGKRIFKELVCNKDIQEYGLTFLNEFQILIDGIAFDLISDAAVQISKPVFIEYTKEQCELHGIPLAPVIIENIFRWDDKAWDSDRVMLPLNPLKNNKPFILTPKTVARRYPEGDYRKFYEEIYKEILVSQARSRLFKGLGKEPKVSLSDLADKYKNKQAVVECLKEKPALRRNFLAKIKEPTETVWLEQLALLRNTNINQIITPEVLETLLPGLPLRGKQKYKFFLKVITHQLNLNRPKTHLIPQIESLVSLCKEKSVLLLGNYGPGSMRLLQLRAILESLGYIVVVVKDGSAKGEALRETVARLSTLVRFVVVEDTFPGGQITEIEILRSIGVVGVIFRESGKQSSFMTRGVSFDSSNLTEKDYSIKSGERINGSDINVGVDWAEARLKEKNRLWNNQYPWT